jgi:TusA-related sulfurtransferase
MEFAGRGMKILNGIDETGMQGKQENSVMIWKKLDITGKTSPYCLTEATKEAKALKQSDELFIICDNFPAITTSIPRIAKDEAFDGETETFG